MKYFNIEYMNHTVLDHTVLATLDATLLMSAERPHEEKIKVRVIRFSGEKLFKLRNEFGIDKQSVLADAMTKVIVEMTGDPKKTVSQSLISKMENNRHKPDDLQMIALQDVFTELAGYKFIFFYDRPLAETKKDPDEFFGVEA